MCRRVRESGEVRAQTDCRVEVMSLAYSSVYGNKVRQKCPRFYILTVLKVILFLKYIHSELQLP